MLFSLYEANSINALKNMGYNKIIASFFASLLGPR